MLDASAKYAVGSGDKTKLPRLAGRQFALLMWMEARVDPAKFAGLAEGDAHVIRNAGPVARQR